MNLNCQGVLYLGRAGEAPGVIQIREAGQASGQNGLEWVKVKDAEIY